MPKRQALGRGLDALLSMDDIKTEGSSSINEIELTKIKVNPNQPRREFDEDALQELASSIAEIGIIQPITLRKMSDDEYQIIAGERRFRASQKAGLTAIPAYIRTADDENVMEMALIENIQREDLNSVEIALAYEHLLDRSERRVSSSETSVESRSMGAMGSACACRKRVSSTPAMPPRRSWRSDCCSSMRFIRGGSPGLCCRSSRDRE